MKTVVDFPAGRATDLLAYGDPNIDLVFAVEHAPAADQKVLGRRLGPYAGGTVANVACAAGRLGRAVQAYGRIGDDEYGQFVARDFEHFGVGTGYLQRVSSTPTAAALIMLEASGEKALVYAPMPGTALQPETLAPALAQSRLLYAMPYDLEEFVQLHALARAAGVPVAIDLEAVMVPDARRLHQLLGMSDLVFMNDSTFRSIAGVEADPAAMAWLLQFGPTILTVTCGARGALAVTRDAQLFQPAFPATLVDSTGAGDCFNGAFLAALLEGQGLDAALRFACAAASIAVGAAGARSALPTRAQLGRLL